MESKTEWDRRTHIVVICFVFHKTHKKKKIEIIINIILHLTRQISGRADVFSRVNLHFGRRHVVNLIEMFRVEYVTYNAQKKKAAKTNTHTNK